MGRVENRPIADRGCIPGQMHFLPIFSYPFGRAALCFVPLNGQSKNVFISFTYFFVSNYLVGFVGLLISKWFCKYSCGGAKPVQHRVVSYICIISHLFLGGSSLSGTRRCSVQDKTSLWVPSKPVPCCPYWKGKIEGRFFYNMLFYFIVITSAHSKSWLRNNIYIALLVCATSEKNVNEWGMLLFHFWYA